MRLEFPAGWEIVAHATSTRTGSLTLADRRDQRAQLSWRGIGQGRRPDLDRMIEDYRSRESQRHPDAQYIEPSAASGWRALRRRSQTTTLTRAVRFEPSADRLVELVLSWPTEFDPAIEDMLLGGFSLVEPTSTPRRWRAFGLDVTAPEGFGIDSALSRPGQSSLDFSARRARVRVTRRGGGGAWYDGRLDVWAYRFSGVRPGVPAMPASHRGHPAVRFRTHESTTRFARLLGRARDREELFWHCPAESALYQVGTLSTRRDTVTPEQVEVVCCRPAE